MVISVIVLFGVTVLGAQYSPSSLSLALPARPSKGFALKREQQGARRERRFRPLTKSPAGA
jgi:hypothetical protein